MAVTQNKKEDFPMYTTDKSTKITFYVTYFFDVILIGLMLFAYPIAKNVLGPTQRTAYLSAVIAFYICCPAAWVALYKIRKLLKNVLADTIFTNETVKLLHQLSWCCGFVAAVCFITIYFCHIFFTFCIGAALMFLLLRVLRNVMGKAVAIKEENELTI